MTEEMLVRAAIRDELSGPLERIRDELKGTAKAAGDAGTKANIGARGFDRMASGAGRFVKAGVGMAAKAAAAGVAALTAAVAVGSVKVLQLASDANEAGSAFRTVFKGVAGDVGGYVDKLNKRFGIATIELQRAATNFGVFGKAAGVSKKELGGFTKDLVSAGLDLSSFYNADPTEVFQALRSGLSGEAEPLRQFGIFLSDATLKAEAATMGLGEELTESQKVMVRQRIIMKSLGDAQGDLVRTQDGLANKTKALKGRFQEAATAIGTALLPYAEQAANKLDKRLGPAVDRLPAKLDALEAKAVGLWQVFQQGGPDAAVAKIDILTGSGGKLVDAWIEAKSIVSDLGTILTAVLVPALGNASTATGGLSAPLGLLRGALRFAADHTTLVRVALTGLIVTLTAAKVITLGVAAATRVKAAADAIALINLKAHTVGTKTHTVVSAAARVGTLLWAGAQRALNLALTMNPIGLVIAAIALLVAGVVIAYKKSETFRAVVDKVWGALKSAWEWAKRAGSYIGGEFAAAWDRAKAGIQPLIDAVRDLIGWIGRIKLPSLDSIGGALNPFGDTSTAKGRGGNLGNTLATHAATAAATGARPRITNALVGGGGKGRGSGDHQAGRALDLQGKGLAKYGAHMRAIGGFAQFHGAGASRHLHVVPPAMGDTRSSMAGRARPRPAPGGGGRTVTVEAGAVVVQVHNPRATVDVKAAVRDALDEVLRDREERS